MAASFYVNATGLPWEPEGVIETLDGRRGSAANILANWSIADIEAAFGVSAPDWPAPAAGQMVDTETVTPDGAGGLTFVRTFKAKPNPNFATVLTTLTAAVKRERKQAALGVLLEVYEAQFTRAEIQTKVAALSPAQRDQLAALFDLTGADLL